jgi:hypothetical protein
MPEDISNISATGIRRRRNMGIAWAIVAIVGAVAAIATDAPQSWRVILALPIALAAVGLLQAYERTCVVLGAVNKRENADGTYSPMPDAECPGIRLQVKSIVLRVLLITAVATAILLAI